MYLAAISFADPLMLAGLLAALVPVVLHLLNRMRAPVVLFPTLQFLKITAQKTARRRQIQQYFLLLIRVIVFALVAMAVAAPLIHGGSPALAYGFVGILLVGLGLLVLALVLGVSALDALKSPKAAAAKTAADKPARPGRLWGFSLAALVTALLLGGYSVYGMVSDRFFSSNLGGEFSGQFTAMVVIFDNSHSMLAAQGPPPAQTRLARAKYLTKQLLGEAISPHQAAILPTNPGPTGGAPAFKTNMFDLAGNLEGLAPTGSARPMQERIRSAVDMLRTAEQPSRMLVIVSDFARPNFSDVDVFAALKNLAWRQDLQIVLMPAYGRRPAGGSSFAGGAPADADDNSVPDAGITSFTLAEGTQRPVVGAEVTFEAQLINNAGGADVRDVALTVEGQPIEAPAGGPLNPRVQLGPAGTPTARATVRIPYRLTQPWLHRFGVQLPDQQDALAWDDGRELVLDVADQIRVLVVGAESGAAPRPRSTAFFFQAALAPFEGAPGVPVPWSVKPTYRGIDQVQNAAALQGFSAVFLCDVPKIAAPLADALTAYARGGGRIIWILGPSIDSANYNQVLLGVPANMTTTASAPGASRGLLPAPLAQPLVAAKAAPLDWVDLRSGLFMNLFDSQDPFRNALITGRWSLADSGAAAVRPLAKLADGAPIFLQHAITGTAETGRIYTLLTTPAADWSNLGATVLLVPLAARMALGDFQEGPGGTTAFDTGQIVPLRIPGLDVAAPVAWRNLTLDVTAPSQAVINVKPSAGNAPQWLFDRAQDAGIYTWKSSDAKYTGMFVVNPPGAEADLLSADLAALAKESSPEQETTGGGRPTIIAYDVPELLTQLQNRAAGTSLTPGFLALVLMLAVLEALLSNRHKPA